MVFRRSVTAFILLLIAGCATAHSPAPSRTLGWESAILYRLEGDGPKPASYLVATVHLADPRFATFPRQLARAVAGVDAVFLEASLRENPTQLPVNAFLPPGKRIASFLSPEVAARLESRFEAAGVSWPRMTRLKPWAIAIALMSLPTSGAHTAPASSVSVDVSLNRGAQAAGKRVAGLESAAEQMEALDSLTIEEQAHLLEREVENERSSRPGVTSTAILNAFLHGDSIRLADLSGNALDMDDPIVVKNWQITILDRNVRLADRIAEKLRSETRPSLFAIGAIHLFGQYGVVERLRRLGVKVTAVNE